MIKIKNKFWVKVICVMSVLLLTALLVAFRSMETTTAFAASSAGDVAGAVEDTWNAAQGQIKQVVNNVIFPIVDLILAVMLFVKLGTAYFDYRKHGQFEFVAPCILFVCLVFTLTAPLYIWKILG